MLSRSSTLLSLVAGLAFAIAGAAAPRSAQAANFSFTGNFTSDDTVQLFNFSVGSSSTVTLQTLSYAGGTNAQGATIARGGFDPILALFDSSGNYIAQNDDGGCGSVSADSRTGQCWDTYLQQTLSPGNYTVSVMEYDNFANRPNLSDGFARQGQGNFTAGNGCVDNQPQFNDVSGEPGCGRDSHWAFDILGVNSAVLGGGGNEGGGNGGGGTGVPEPTALLLLGLGLTGLAARRKA